MCTAKVTALKGVMYAIGGVDEGGRVLKSMEILDTVPGGGGNLPVVLKAAAGPMLGNAIPKHGSRRNVGKSDPEASLKTGFTFGLPPTDAGKKTAGDTKTTALIDAPFKDWLGWESGLPSTVRTPNNRCVKDLSRKTNKTLSPVLNNSPCVVF